MSEGSLTDAQNALLEVARRNPEIQSTADLPATKEGLMEFIKAERVRELWMEGHRFTDLRRWGRHRDYALFSNRSTLLSSAILFRMLKSIRVQE